MSTISNCSTLESVLPWPWEPMPNRKLLSTCVPSVIFFEVILPRAALEPFQEPHQGVLHVWGWILNSHQEYCLVEAPFEVRKANIGLSMSGIVLKSSVMPPFIGSHWPFLRPYNHSIQILATETQVTYPRWYWRWRSFQKRGPFTIGTVHLYKVLCDSIWERVVHNWHWKYPNLKTGAIVHRVAITN